LQRVGFTSPERAIVYYMQCAEATGRTTSPPAILIKGGVVVVPTAQTLVAFEAPQDVPIYDWTKLDTGANVRGPAIILEPTGTNIIEPDWFGTIDEIPR
jgi:5-oxoprolinase (ATP-hydrolysing)